MKKRVLLIGHNFFPEPTGIGKYSGDMMEWFTKHDYDCTVVTTFPYYPFWKVQVPYKNRWYKKETIKYAESATILTVYRCPSYVPANPSGKKRMIQDVSFWTSMFWVVLKLMLFNKKHDYVITIAPPFHLGYLAWFYKKVKGGKLIYHIQDLQIEAAQELKILSNEKLFNWLYAAERSILKGADYVSSISEGMIAKIGSKAQREVLFFPNWADTDNFRPIDGRAALKTHWGFKEDQFVCLYSGSIGEKQGLENILLCAEIFKDSEKIKFVICGIGPYREKLIDMATLKNLNNVSFFPLQEKSVFNDFLNMADVHLVIQKGNAGDLVMPSKLTTILSVGGVSLITASENTSLYNLAVKYGIGFTVPPDDYSALAETIVLLADKNLDVQRDNARAYALKYLNIDNVMNKFIADIDGDSITSKL